MTFGGLPTRWEPTGESRGVALVAPGRAYSPAAPLLEFARRALLQHGFTVQQLWWDSTTRGEDDEPEQWVRRHVEAAHAAEEADHVLVVGKSLGTRAASYAAERGLDAIWLTPSWSTRCWPRASPPTPVASCSSAAWPTSCGTPRSPASSPTVVVAGCDVLEVPDADHSMGTDDAVRTAEIHLEVARAVEAFLASL